MRRWTMIVAGLLIATPAAAQDSGPAAATVAVERTLPFSASGAFRVHVMEGSVRARPWDRDSVRVVARLEGESGRGFYLGVTPKGDGGKMGIEGDGRAEVDITLPRGASLWVKTAGGAVEVDDIAGSVDVFSVTGDLRVRGSPRSLHAESMGGAVSLEGAPSVARLRTGAGDIRVREGGPDLTLSSVSGGIEVRRAAPLRRALVETVSGVVRVMGGLAPGSTVVVNSHDGPVELALPDSTSADFVVSTLEGELRNRLTTGGARKTTGLRGRELTFTSGFGGAEVTVRTFSGAVVIRPLDGG